MRVRGFARAQQLPIGLVIDPVESSAPLDQFRHPQRTFLDQNRCGRPMHEPVAGRYGVLKMQGDVLLALRGYRDPALGVVGVGFSKRLFGDDENVAVIGEFDGCTQACDAFSDL